MPLRLFRSRNVAGANVLQALLVAGMFGMFFLGALYLQRVLGYSALEVGLAFLPTTIVMGTLSLGFSEKLIMRFGPRTTLIPGVCMTVVALLLFARTPVDGNYLTDLLPPFLLIGVGIGTAFPAIMTLAMSGATPEDAGLASGLVNTSMQVGGAIGLAVLATLSTERTQTPARQRRLERLGADLRLPPRLPGRRRAGRDRGRDRGLRPARRRSGGRSRSGAPKPSSSPSASRRSRAGLLGAG